MSEPSADGQGVSGEGASGKWAIVADGLRRQFGKKCAVRDLSLNVPRGSIHALLGPNGAGKSVSIGMLTTRLRPSGGHASILGHDLLRAAGEIRARIAVTGQNASLDEDITGQENLMLMARIFGLGGHAARQRVAELLSRFGLEEAARRPVKTYSGGMRRRLDIAASLVVPPALLFLDEPTTGLDPQSRQDVWALVRELAAGGTTVLMTTQYLEEADQLADRISVIRDGAIIAEGSASELKRLAGGGALTLKFADPVRKNAAQRLLAAGFGAQLQAVDPTRLRLRADEAERARVPLVALEVLKTSGLMPEEFSFAPPSLDEVFLSLTGSGSPMSVAPTARSHAIEEVL